MQGLLCFIQLGLFFPLLPLPLLLSQFYGHPLAFVRAVLFSQQRMYV